MLASKFLNPKNDLTFKRIFGIVSEQHPISEDQS